MNCLDADMVQKKEREPFPAPALHFISVPAALRWARGKPEHGRVGRDTPGHDKRARDTTEHGSWLLRSSFSRLSSLPAWNHLPSRE